MGLFNIDAGEYACDEFDLSHDLNESNPSAEGEEVRVERGPVQGVGGQRLRASAAPDDELHGAIEACEEWKGQCISVQGDTTEVRGLNLYLVDLDIGFSLKTRRLKWFLCLQIADKVHVDA